MKRRQFITTAAAVPITAGVAGCIDPDAQYEQLTDSDHMEIVAVEATNGFFPGTAYSELTIVVDDGLEADALVWLGPSGGQVAVETMPYGVPYGGGEVKVDSGAAKRDILGENKLVGVEGGEKRCRSCDYYGGESVASVEFKIGR